MHMNIVGPNWDGMTPDAMAMVQRTIATAVLDADKDCWRIQRERDNVVGPPNGDPVHAKAAEAAYAVILLVAQTDLIGRRVLLITTFTDREKDDLHTVEGVVLRATEIVLNPAERSE